MKFYHFCVNFAYLKCGACVFREPCTFLSANLTVKLNPVKVVAPAFG